MEVSHEGGIFTTRILERDSDTARRLVAENARVMEAFGMVRGISHTEFIRAEEDGRVYFLETSARVGSGGVRNHIHGDSERMKCGVDGNACFGRKRNALGTGATELRIADRPALLAHARLPEAPAGLQQAVVVGAFDDVAPRRPVAEIAPARLRAVRHEFVLVDLGVR